MKDWGNFLHRVLEKDSEDSTPIKAFFLVWRFGGKQQRPPVVVGGGEEGVKVWVGI